MTPLSGGASPVINRYAIEPAYCYSGDLEGAAKNITNTTKPVVGSATYTAASKSISGLVGLDALFTLISLACQMRVTVDALNGGCAHVYVSLVVDQDDADHTLFDSIDIAAASQVSKAALMNASNKTVLYNLLKDGSAHTYYFLMWVDAGNADISEAQFNCGISVTGTGSSAYGGIEVLKFACGNCRVRITGRMEQLGSASKRLFITCPQTTNRESNFIYDSSGVTTSLNLGSAVEAGPVYGSVGFRMSCTTTTDDAPMLSMVAIITERWA